jgi:DNA-binding transcriptional LysR family regulator
MHQSDVRGADARAIWSRVDLNLLALFDCLYRNRNLTAAGVQLGLSQPAVSRGLARLREAYGDVLFVRQQRGVLPTPFADHLAEPLAAALAIVHGTVERLSFDPSSDSRHFRIAMSDIGERFFLPKLLEHLSNAAPAVSIESVSPSVPELAAGLAGGDVDLVAGFLPALGKQVHEQRLFHEKFVYVARTGHPSVRGRLLLGQLRTLAHVVADPPGTPHAAAVERVLANRRVRATVALRVRSFLCVAPIIAQTDLIAAVPSKLAALVSEHMNLQLIDPPVHFPGFDVSMAWHRRFHRDPAIEWLRGVFTELLSDRRRS